MQPAATIAQDLNKEQYRDLIVQQWGQEALDEHDRQCRAIASQVNGELPENSYKEFITNAETEINKCTAAFKELIEMNVWLLRDEAYRATYESQCNDDFFTQFTRIQAWLDLSSQDQYNRLPDSKKDYSKIISSFAKFTFPDSIDHPLIIALKTKKVATVRALIHAGAPVYEGMLQFGLSASLPAELTQEMVNLLPYYELPKLLAKAVSINSFPFMVTLLKHPDMNFDYLLQRDTIHSIDGSRSSIFEHAKYKGNKPMLDLIKNTLIEKIYKKAITEPTLILRYEGIVTQRELADYMLAKARALPPTEASIGLIRHDLAVLENPDSALYYFLRGYVLSRLRTALIKDLHKEIVSRRTALLAAKPETGESPDSAATGRTVTFLAPGNIPTPVGIDRVDRKIAQLEVEVNLTNRL